MTTQHVNGDDRGHIMLYALSTCIWCRKTKRLLSALGVMYDYIDVDLLDEKEQTLVKKEIKKWNPRISFPTLVINDTSCVIGYDEAEIKENLGNG
ncbi:glutaredoxin family protein [candidate division WOR-3 bacterium]|nr:glutaredoxin family protein [candidate division WOR-3 bacterium]